MTDLVTPDDSAWCRLCDPPHETSLAMLPVHLELKHGVPRDLIADAPIIDLTGAEGEPA